MQKNIIKTNFHSSLINLFFFLYYQKDKHYYFCISQNQFYILINSQKKLIYCINKNLFTERKYYFPNQLEMTSKGPTQPNFNNEKEKIQQRIQTIELTLQSFLNTYQLQDIQQMAQILFDKQLSEMFKKKYPQLDRQNERQTKITQKLKKMAFQHTYHEMFIYYQQFPLLMQECRKVLRHKYQNDDILRTHQNRKSIWILCSGAFYKMKQNPLYYQKLTQYQSLYPQYFKFTIEKDVLRTVQDKNKQYEQILRSVLQKIAIKNPYIGYCQGMNFIVYFLIIMQFTQEEIFWLTSQLLQDFLPKSYYTNMMGVAVDISVIQYYVKMYQPVLYDKLQSMSITLSLFTLEWLVCLFTSTLPFYMIVIIWDMMFIYGPSILLKVCIVVLEQLEETILNSNELSELLVIIQSKKKGIFIEQSRFIQRISQIYIDQDLLIFCRELIQLNLLKQKVQLNQNTKSQKKNVNIQCNIEWPICFKALKQHKSDMGQIEVWTFKQQGPLRILNDYLINLNKKGYKPSQDNRTQDKKLLIGRIPHSCDVKQYNKKNQIQKQIIELNDFDKKETDEDTDDNEETVTNNEHIDFYKRITSSKLSFMNYGTKKQNQSHRLTSSMAQQLYRPRRKQQNLIIYSNVRSSVGSSSISQYSNNLDGRKNTKRNSSNNIQKIMSKLSHSNAKIIEQQQYRRNDSYSYKISPNEKNKSESNQNTDSDSINPFKILKQKWRQRRKSKQFTSIE